MFSMLGSAGSRAFRPSLAIIAQRHEWPVEPPSILLGKAFAVRRLLILLTKLQFSDQLRADPRFTDLRARMGRSLFRSPVAGMAQTNYVNGLTTWTSP